MNIDTLGIDGIGTTINPEVSLTIIQYTPEMIIAIMVMTYIVSVVIHELAHYYMLRQWSSTAKILYYHDKGQMPKIQTGIMSEYDNLSIKARMQVYASGVLAGSLFIFVIAAVAYAWAALLFIPYLMSCKKDIQLFMECAKELG